MLVTLTAGAKFQYKGTLVRVKGSCDFENICDHIGKTTMHLNQILLCLGTYLYPINYFSKQKWVMRCGTRKPRELKVRRYLAHMVKLNEYLDIFTSSKARKTPERHNLMKVYWTE